MFPPKGKNAAEISDRLTAADVYLEGLCKGPFIYIAYHPFRYAYLDNVRLFIEPHEVATR